MKASVDRRALEGELAGRLGEAVRLVPLIEGEESRVFGLSTTRGELVLRIHPTGRGFDKDAFIARRFGSTDLPIPRIVEFGVLGGGLHFCLSEKASGRTLQALDVSELERTAEPVAAVMEAMARVDVSAVAGVGPFDAEGNAGFTSWRKFLTNIADRKAYDWERVCVGAEPPTRLIALICALAETCPEERRLVHGDFGSNNVLVDGDRITGVIDWSEAMVGDPLYDVANILFWRPWLDCMEAQATYFERQRPEWLADSRRLACYQLRIGLDEVFDALLTRNGLMLNWALARCEDIAT